MTDAFGRPTDPADRGFGDVGHAASPGQSPAMREAATNLLHKAVKALEAAHRDRALGYVRRAATLPDDDNGGAAPLSLAAHIYALEAVLDVFELGQGVWIDAAEALVHAPKARTPLAVADFRHVLTVVRKEYRTTPAEGRRLDALIAGGPVASIREMQQLAGEELSAVVIDLLDLIVEYGRTAGTIIDECGADDF